MTQNCFLTRACFYALNYAIHGAYIKWSSGPDFKKKGLYVELKIYDKNRRKITGPQCVNMHVSLTVGLRLPTANCLHRLITHLFVCLQLQAAVVNSIAITEYPAAFINPLMALNNPIKQSKACVGLRSDIPESCTIS
jgi:hypothetical protein